MFKLDAHSNYRVNPEVSFRYEEFGGIVYRRSDDRLFFLKIRQAIDLLRLAGSGTVAEIAAKLGNAISDRAEIQRYVLSTLAALEELGIVNEFPDRNVKAGGADLPDMADYA